MRDWSVNHDVSSKQAFYEARANNSVEWKPHQDALIKMKNQTKSKDSIKPKLKQVVKSSIEPYQRPESQMKRKPKSYLQST